MDLGCPLQKQPPTQLSLELSNGSRILSLPGDESTVRGFSNVSALIVDEAARVEDALYLGIRPMLAVSRGRLIALSSAYARLGWFFECWVGSEPWRRVMVKAAECPRIDPAFLEEEKIALGPRYYAMEYEGEFGDLIGSVFRGCDIERALDPALEPMFP
jgi:hypothetical protein